MLVEMMSPAFKEKSEVRPPIKFKDGLNVVLGKEDGTNSIGKSSALLAIDFAFGGDGKSGFFLDRSYRASDPTFCRFVCLFWRKRFCFV